VGILGNGHADPDTDLYQRQAYEKADKLNIFNKISIWYFKKLKMMTPLTLMRRIKHRWQSCDEK
jgi:hypothetical protein